ncbi:hypothetical protein B9Z55_027957 [Caenorhabditis nigoni]|uniref:Uncharacterized protein n=1 Tax=Caenorhabditis nigoni TaxID=1611254 RepID=A0A2G5SDS0_9PELO|nr:hypothetical protein B9Z55_027957 [Caenorhabditis nigoni]
MSSLASHVCLPLMGPSNLEVRIPNELPLALCANFFASSESNENRFILVPDKLKLVSYEIPDGVFKTEWQRKEYSNGSQKLPQAVSRLPIWKALRNQYLRMMHMDDTPFGQ